MGSVVAFQRLPNTVTFVASAMAPISRSDDESMPGSLEKAAISPAPSWEGWVLLWKRMKRLIQLAAGSGCPGVHVPDQRALSSPRQQQEERAALSGPQIQQSNPAMTTFTGSPVRVILSPSVIDSF